MHSCPIRIIYLCYNYYSYFRSSSSTKEKEIQGQVHVSPRTHKYQPESHQEAQSRVKRICSCLTHCGLVMLNGNIDLSQHWLSLVAWWWHQAIAWTNVDLSSMGCMALASGQFQRSAQYITMVSCQKGPTRHAYTWQIGPFWQDTLNQFIKWVFSNFLITYHLSWSNFRPSYEEKKKMGMIKKGKPFKNNKNRWVNILLLFVTMTPKGFISDTVRCRYNAIVYRILTKYIP